MFCQEFYSRQYVQWLIHDLSGGGGGGDEFWVLSLLVVRLYAPASFLHAPERSEGMHTPSEKYEI